MRIEKKKPTRKKEHVRREKMKETGLRTLSESTKLVIRNGM